jgi:hypothetical protein
LLLSGIGSCGKIEFGTEERTERGGLVGREFARGGDIFHDNYFCVLACAVAAAAAAAVAGGRKK